MKIREFPGVMAAMAAGLMVIGGAAGALADSTINSTDKFGYGANIGWINFKHDQPSAPEGAVIGEFVCSGFVYSANCGWIDLGDGTPVNQIQYQNNAANDFGVNVTGHASDGVNCQVKLRGFAYGANIGWINFENTGDPRVNLATGELRGYAYSANCGWINLGEGGMTPVKTDTIKQGNDSDTDGLADAYELTHAANLGVMNGTTDTDGDGVSDLNESAADTDPDNANDRLAVVSITGGGLSTTTNIMFTSKATRKYSILKSDLSSPWVDSGLGQFPPAGGSMTSKTVPAVANGRQYFRVVAKKPLTP